ATTEVKHMPLGRCERHEQLDGCRDHVVVVRDQAPDLDVVASSVDVEMTLDRVRPATGHWPSLHLRRRLPSTSAYRCPIQAVATISQAQQPTTRCCSSTTKLWSTNPGSPSRS